MYYYAVLNPVTHICEAVEQLDEELTNYNTNEYIQISSYDTTLIGKKYNFETQSWEDPSETDACNVLASQVKLGTRRLDLFIGDETGLSLGSNTPNNMVAAINQCFQFASNGKEAIADAITGVDDSLTIPDNPTFAQLAALISQLGTLNVEIGSMQVTTIPENITGVTSFRPKIVIVYNFGSGLANFNMGVYVSPLITESTTQQVTDSANVTTAIAGKSAGVYTFQSVAGTAGAPTSTEAYKYLCHKTSSTQGWVIAFGTSGNVYTNYCNSGTWSGWKSIHTQETPLWSGSSQVKASDTITPSKKLDECNHGWVLMWSDYNVDTNTPSESDIATTLIPKKNAAGNNWTGQDSYSLLPTYVTTAQAVTVACKRLKVYNNRIVGYDLNEAEPANDVVLRAIYEY